MFKIALKCVHNLVKTNQKSIKKDFLNGNAFNNLNNLIYFPYLDQSYYQKFTPVLLIGTVLKISCCLDFQIVLYL